MYTIIEDCSPYYIRFTHTGINDVIDKCSQYLEHKKFTRAFTHHIHPPAEAESILASVPLTSQLDINVNRVSSFVTQPGVYYRVHKDGLDCRTSINYTVKILDDKCVTSWYSDQDVQCAAFEGLDWKIPSREVSGFDQTSCVPLKSMTAKQGECILFNTDIFHDFDNSNSQDERTVLTLRLNRPGEYSFDEIKKILFGI